MMLSSSPLDLAWEWLFCKLVVLLLSSQFMRRQKNLDEISQQLSLGSLWARQKEGTKQILHNFFFPRKIDLY